MTEEQRLRLARWLSCNDPLTLQNLAEQFRVTRRAVVQVLPTITADEINAARKQLAKEERRWPMPKTRSRSCADSDLTVRHFRFHAVLGLYRYLTRIGHSHDETIALLRCHLNEEIVRCDIQFKAKNQKEKS